MDFDDKIERFRRVSSAIAELVDAYRLAPRLILAQYSYWLWDAYQWYIHLAVPTTEQTALLATIVGFAGVIFGFYSKSGREWKDGFISWKKGTDVNKKPAGESEDPPAGKV